MRIADVLHQSSLPPLESELLLSSVLKQERTWLLAHAETDVSPGEVNAFFALAKRRMLYEPMAYILGEKEFYGRTFHVSPDVLIPRPETEELVSAVMRYIQHRKESISKIGTDIVAFFHTLREEAPTCIVDIGTGSGCIGITLALETKLPVIGTDTSSNALKIAAGNAHHLNASNLTEWRKGDLLDPVRDVSSPFLLISNPPYIPSEEVPMKDVMQYEPHEALFAGEEGMDVLVRLVKQAKEHPNCCGVALECRAFQAEKLQKIL